MRRRTPSLPFQRGQDQPDYGERRRKQRVSCNPRSTNGCAQGWSATEAEIETGTHLSDPFAVNPYGIVDCALRSMHSMNVAAPLRERRCPTRSMLADASQPTISALTTAHEYHTHLEFKDKYTVNVRCSPAPR
jgi:hypothetical protein